MADSATFFIRTLVNSYCKMLDWPVFGYSLPILFTMFLAMTPKVPICLNDSRAIVTILEGHLKNDKQSFKNVKG